jgi:hypothetical protein
MAVRLCFRSTELSPHRFHHLNRRSTRGESNLPACLEEFGLSDDPSRPAYSALFRALENRCNDLIHIGRETESWIDRANPSDSDCEAKLEERLKQITKLINEMQELCRWLIPDRIPLSGQEALRSIRRLITSNYSTNVELASAVLPALQKRQVGRPNKRVTYLAVFDVMLEGSHMSLGKARLKFGRQLTQENVAGLKTGLRDLKQLLRIYAPELVLQFERMHPNRDKKVNG